MWARDGVDVRVTTSHHGARLVLEFEPQGDEPVKAVAAMGSRPVTFDPVPTAPLHPDVVALVALLSTHPWIEEGLEVDRPVSQVFAAAVQHGLGLTVGPVDPAVEPRLRSADGPVALAFSGGVDCTAALELLGTHTRLYYQQRSRFDGQELEGHLDPAAALAAIRHVEDLGVPARVVRSDVELLREPVGFPHDLQNAAPALLWADQDGTSAMCWGTVLTSATLLGATAYRPYEDSPFIAEWGPAFQAVGLQVANVVAGLSEVGTEMITAASRYGAVAASCQRGAPGEPCMKCWKCGRKTLSLLGLTDQWPSGEDLDRFLQQREIAFNLRKNPIKVEVALAWAAGRYHASTSADHRSEVMAALYDLTRGVDASPMAAHFTPALDPLPERLRQRVVDAASAHLPVMTPEQEAWVRNWSLEQHGSEQDRAAARKRLKAALDPERNAVDSQDFDPRSLAPQRRGGQTPPAVDADEDRSTARPRWWRRRSAGA